MNWISLLGLATVLVGVPWLCGAAPHRAKALSVSPCFEPPGRHLVPVAIVIELLAAALATGVSVPRALFGVGQAVGGTTGQKLSRAGRQLELGATWVQAWAEAESDLAVIVEALQAAWEDGAPPIETLRAASQAERQRQKAAAKLAAARLGVRLVLPLGLCLLPAFVLIGLVPILISLGSLLVF